MTSASSGKAPHTVTLTVEMTFEVPDPDAVVGKALRQLVPANVSPEVRNAEVSKVRDDLRRAIVWNIDWSSVVDGESLKLAGLEFLDLEAPGEGVAEDPVAKARERIVALAHAQRGLAFMTDSAPAEMRHELEWEPDPLTRAEAFIGALAWAIDDMAEDLAADIAALRERPADEAADELIVVAGLPVRDVSVVDARFAERFQQVVAEVAAAMRTTWRGTPTVADQLAVALAVQQVQRLLGAAQVALPGTWFTWQREALFSDMSFARLLEPGFDSEASPKGLGLRTEEWFTPVRR